MPITATATVAPPPSHPHEILKTQKTKGCSALLLTTGATLYCEVSRHWSPISCPRYEKNNYERNTTCNPIIDRDYEEETVFIPTETVAASSIPGGELG